MNKDKILFVVPDFEVGGISSALYNLTSLLIDKGHEVTVVNFAKSERPKEFDERVIFTELSGFARLWNLSADDLNKAKGFKKIGYAALGVVKKILNKSEKWHSLVFRKTFFKGYDVAVAFRQSPFAFWFVKNRTDAGLKVGFWHGDVEYMGDISSWDYTLGYLDRLACVSDAVKEGMIKRYPFLEGKAYTVYNTFDDLLIAKKSEEYTLDYDRNFFNIVTVSRIDFSLKRTDLIIEIVKRVKESADCNRAFKWHIVGDGADSKKMKTIILEEGLNDTIILEGASCNPYPYMRSADLTVLTSRSESYGMVVVESLICGTPVVAGCYPALPEVLQDGINGIIAENSPLGIADVIVDLINNNEKYNKLKENCKNYQYDREIAYRQFMEMVK